jgi:GDPmannose 4,6-dehydratase
MFGASSAPQSEVTPFYPRSPYAVSNVAAHWYAVNYREACGLFISNGILFNHESPRRGETFVTRKITRGLARIKLGVEKRLLLGNLDAKRDWGYARDYMEGAWRMLQAEKADDYVLATGETHSVREFAQIAAPHLDFNLVWEGAGLAERGIDTKTGMVLIEIDPRYFRPTEVDILRGDTSKAMRELGWKADTRFEELTELMTTSDYDLAAKDVR